jgi:hypothetical protein
MTAVEPMTTVEPMAVAEPERDAWSIPIGLIVIVVAVATAHGAAVSAYVAMPPIPS